MNWYIKCLVIQQYHPNRYEFLFASSVTDEADTQPSTVGFINLVCNSTSKWGVLMAATFLAALPTLLVYILLGRFFLRGLMEDALKG